MIVKTAYSLGLLVMIVGGIGYMTVPQSVIGKYESTWSHKLKHHLVSLDICALVAINKCHIKLYTKLRSLNIGITNAKLNMFGYRRALKPRTGKVFHLVVYLKRPYLTNNIIIASPLCTIDTLALLARTLCNLSQSFSHTYSTIARKCAHFKDVLWTYHLDKHLEQTAL